MTSVTFGSLGPGTQSSVLKSNVMTFVSTTRYVSMKKSISRKGKYRSIDVLGGTFGWYHLRFVMGYPQTRTGRRKPVPIRRDELQICRGLILIPSSKSYFCLSEARAYLVLTKYHREMAQILKSVCSDSLCWPSCVKATRQCLSRKLPQFR